MEAEKINLGIGELENKVLNAVWDMEQSPDAKIFVSDVLTRIKTPHKKWAYTTVKTVLDRMVDKDMLSREREGKRFHYQSTVRRDSARELALKKVLRQYFENDVNKMSATVELLCKHGVDSTGD